MPTCLPTATFAGPQENLWLPKSGNVTVNGTLRVDGNPTAGTSLRVIGATRLDGNVDVTGAVNVDAGVIATSFTGPEDAPAILSRGAAGVFGSALQLPGGAVGLNGDPLFLPSGYLGPLRINPVQLTGNGIPIPYLLQSDDNGTYIALSKVNGSTGPFIINFTPDSFPEGGTFFIKNVDKDDPITIYFAGADIGASGSPNSILLPTNQNNGSNGFLCVARYLNDGLKVY